MEPVLAVVTLFAGNFAPYGWAICNGQQLSINDNTALFALVGTTYGGDGQTTFAIPDFRGRMAVGTGGGIVLGEQSGANTQVITINQMPAHTHNVTAASISTGDAIGTLTNPNNNIYGGQSSGTFAAASTANGQLGGVTGSLAPTGGSQPFNTRMPYLGLNYIIALEGIFPSRS